MARLAYADPSAPQLRELTDAIRAGRGDVLLLYQMLLHSPPVAAGWLGFLTAIRQQTGLPPAIRELIIMRIAGLNGADYEADQHHPIALACGVSAEKLAALPHWEASTSLFTDFESAVLALTDAMTRHIQVPEAVFQALRRHLQAREIVELVATVAAYNMVSRFLEALEIHSDD